MKKILILLLGLLMACMLAGCTVSEPMVIQDEAPAFTAPLDTSSPSAPTSIPSENGLNG